MHSWWLGRGPVLGSMCVHAALLLPWIYLLVADRVGIGDGTERAGRAVRVAMAEPDRLEELVVVESSIEVAPVPEASPLEETTLDQDVEPLAEEVPAEPEPIEERSVDVAHRMREPEPTATSFPATAFTKPPWERRAVNATSRSSPTVETSRSESPAEPSTEARPSPATTEAGTTGDPGRASGERVLPKRLPDASPAPRYPARWARAGITGVVRLRVRVSVDGVPASVTIHESSGHAVLDRLAMDTVQRSWRFAPGTRDGTPEPMDVLLRFRFEEE